MPLPEVLRRARLPIIGAPMFLVSWPELVIAQCKAGVIGSLPALNARPATLLDEWLDQIGAEITAWDAAHPEAPAAPFAINLIVHATNTRLESDLETCAKHKVPILITSLGAREEVNSFARGYGGFVFHDVTTTAFARKAIEKGADGLVLVCAGAGGHGGVLSPFALMQETRGWYDGPIALSGAIASGAGICAARALGADFAYIGSPFIAASEAQASDAYKQMVVAANAGDIVYTDYFSGIRGNYLRQSIAAAGYDPDNLPLRSERVDVDGGTKAWRDIWACGQGIGVVKAVEPVASMVERWMREASIAANR